jgi:glutathione S-transferase
MIQSPDSPHSEVLSPVRTKAKKKPRIQNSAAPSLELFQLESCPECHLVRRKLSELGADFIARTVSPGSALKHEQLIQASGKDQIPFLIDHITGTKLFESMAIVSYLDKQYGKTKPTPVLRWAERIKNTVQLRSEEFAWAILEPVHQIERLGGDARQALREVSGSWKAVRKALTGKSRAAPSAQAD